MDRRLKQFVVVENKQFANLKYFRTSTSLRTRKSVFASRLINRRLHRKRNSISSEKQSQSREKMKIFEKNRERNFCENSQRTAKMMSGECWVRLRKRVSRRDENLPIKLLKNHFHSLTKSSKDQTLVQALDEKIVQPFSSETFKVPNRNSSKFRRVCKRKFDKKLKSFEESFYYGIKIKSLNNKVQLTEAAT